MNLKNNLSKEFVTSEQAKELQTLGFNEVCLGYYRHYTDGKKELRFDNSKMRNIEAPTYSQALRWFREKHNLYPSLSSSHTDNKIVKDMFLFLISFDRKLKQFSEDWYYKTYEEAEQACLNKLIEIVKNDKSK
jgi:hypothetical protein